MNVVNIKLNKNNSLCDNKLAALYSSIMMNYFCCVFAWREEEETKYLFITL